MSGNNWGGKREGAGSGGKRKGAGRPRKTFNTGGKGAILFMEYPESSDEPFTPAPMPKQLRVLSVTENAIELQDIETEEIYTLMREWE